MAQENQAGDSEQPEAAQEAEVTIFNLIGLMLKLGSSEIPLVTISMFCVLAATLIDNITPDVQGRIFSDLYGTPGARPPHNEAAAMPHDDGHVVPWLPHLKLSTSPAISSFVNHLLDYLYCLLGSMAFSTIQTQSFKVYLRALSMSPESQCLAYRCPKALSAVPIYPLSTT